MMNDRLVLDANIFSISAISRRYAVMSIKYCIKLKIQIKFQNKNSATRRDLHVKDLFNF